MLIPPWGHARACRLRRPPVAPTPRPPENNVLTPLRSYGSIRTMQDNEEPNEPQNQSPSGASLIGPDQIQEIVLRQRQEQSARMSNYWKDPNWADPVRKKMSQTRQQKKVVSRMRDSIIEAGRRRARETGITPLWMPKKVSVLEPSGSWVVFSTISQCAKNYGIKDSTMRAILKHKRTWNGLRFVQET